jgi:adenylate cyclase
MNPIQLVVDAPGEDRKILPVAGPLTIGRAPDNAIVLRDPRVSGHHASIEPFADGWLVRDLCSSNGTFVNGARRESQVLAEGDEVALGSSRLAVRLAPDPRPDGGRIRLVDDSMQDIHTLRTGSVRVGFPSAAEIGDFAALQAEYERLRVASELQLRLGMEHESTGLLHRILDFCFRVLPVDDGAAVLVEPDGTVRPCVDRSRHADPIPVSRSVIARIRETSEALLLADVRVDPALARAHSLEAGGVRSLMAVPITVSGQVHAVMMLANRASVAAFREQDLEMVIGIAAQTSLAFERIELERRVQDEARTMAALTRFLPPGLLASSYTRRMDLVPEGSVRPLAVLYADLRGFTSYTARSGAVRTVEMLNEHFEAMCEGGVDCAGEGRCGGCGGELRGRCVMAST